MDGRSQAIFTPALESMCVSMCLFSSKVDGNPMGIFPEKKWFISVCVCGFVWFSMLAEILRMTRTSGKVHDGSLNFGWSARSSSQHHFSFKSIKIKDAVFFVWFLLTVQTWFADFTLHSNPYFLKNRSSSHLLEISTIFHRVQKHFQPTTTQTPPPKIRRRRAKSVGYLFPKIDFTHGAAGVAGWMECIFVFVVFFVLYVFLC